MERKIIDKEAEIISIVTEEFKREESEQSIEHHYNIGIRQIIQGVIISMMMNFVLLSERSKQRREQHRKG
jgi:hypothetical protein